MTNEITRTSTELVIPFGKYKGRSVGEVSGIDPQYLEWLAAQDWFAKKYQPIYNIIAAPTDDMSPEHNSLQVKFLNDELCISLSKLIYPFDKKRTDEDVEDAVTDSIYDIGRILAEPYMRGRRETLELLKEQKEQIEIVNGRRKNSKEANEYLIKEHQHKIANVAKVEGEIARIKKFHKEYIAGKRKLERKILKRSFEGISDVNLEIATVFSETAGISGALWDRNFNLWVEVKPSIGDDYPAILRQVKDQARRAQGMKGKNVVVYESYSGIGATENQVRQMFNESDISIVKFNEIAS